MLKIGESPVSAKIWWNCTHIQLEPGHVYRFAASGQWADDGIRPCDASGYTLSDIVPWKRPLFKLAGPLRPMNTGERWFSLLGKVGNKGQPFEISVFKELKCDREGFLFCTVNDLRWMYWNNNGSLKVEVFYMGKCFDS